jgi:hypothetical protein
MSRVLCISYPGKKVFGKTEIKVEIVDKEINDLNGTKLDWVVKSLERKKSPTNLELKPCPWHSGAWDPNGDPNNVKRCYTQNPPDFGIWVTGYNVFDTCHIQEDLDKKKEEEEVRKMEKLCSDIDKLYQNAIEVHSNFDSELTKRNKLQNEVKNMEKSLSKVNVDLDTNHPQYKILSQLVEREKLSFQNKVENLRKAYINSDKNGAWDEFLANHSSQEKIRLQKAEENFQNWCNTNRAKNNNSLSHVYESQKRILDSLNDTLRKNYNIPFAYVYKAKQSLCSMYSYYCRYKLERAYSKSDINNDILKFNIMLQSYSEFISEKDYENVAREVDDQQKKAIKLEREIRNTSTVYKVANKQPALVPIVSDDGTVNYENVKEKIIVGSIATGSWRDRGL